MARFGTEIGQDTVVEWSTINVLGVLTSPSPPAQTATIRLTLASHVPEQIATPGVAFPHFFGFSFTDRCSRYADQGDCQ